MPANPIEDSFRVFDNVAKASRGAEVRNLFMVGYLSDGSQVTYNRPAGGAAPEPVAAKAPAESPTEAPPADEPPWEASDVQCAVLSALEGRYLKTDDLEHESGVNRGRLFGKRGIPELREMNMVGHHHGKGYYCTFAPPPGIAARRSA